MNAGAVAMHLINKGMAQVTVTGNGRERLLVRLQVGSGLEPGDATAEGTAADWTEAWRIVALGVGEIVGAMVRQVGAAEVCRRFEMEPGTAAQQVVSSWERPRPGATRTFTATARPWGAEDGPVGMEQRRPLFMEAVD